MPSKKVVTGRQRTSRQDEMSLVRCASNAPHKQLLRHQNTADGWLALVTLLVTVLLPASFKVGHGPQDLASGLLLRQ